MIAALLTWLTAVDQQYPWLAPLSAILGILGGLAAWARRWLVEKAHQIRREAEENNEKLKADIAALKDRFARLENEASELRERLPEAAWEAVDRERRNGNEENSVRTLRHHMETEGAKLSGMAHQIARFHFGLVTERDHDRHFVPAERFALLAFHLDPRQRDAGELLREVQQLRGTPFEHVMFTDDVSMPENKSGDYYVLPQTPEAVVSLIDDASKAVDRGHYRHAHALADAAFMAARRWPLGERESMALSARYWQVTTLDHLGRYEQALDEIDGTDERDGILALREQSPDLGSEHLSTLATRKLRAQILQNLGRYEQALAQIDGADERNGILALEEHSLGPEHPDALATRSLRGAILRDVGRCEESERELRSVGTAQEKVLGPSHDRALRTGHRLATTLTALGQLDEAEELLRVVIEGRRTALGHEHPDTQAAIADLEALRRRNNGSSIQSP